MRKPPNNALQRTAAPLANDEATAMSLAVVLTLLLSMVVSCHQNAAAKRLVPLELDKTSAGVRDKSMVLIPGATFKMGIDTSEIAHLQQVFAIERADLFSAEVPRHTVTIDSFYLDRYEVTNAQFKKFLEKNPQWRQDRIPERYHNGNYLRHWNGNSYSKEKALHPVTNVSWYAVAAYCQWAGKRQPGIGCVDPADALESIGNCILCIASFNPGEPGDPFTPGDSCSECLSTPPLQPCPPPPPPGPDCNSIPLMEGVPTMRGAVLEGPLPLGVTRLTGTGCLTWQGMFGSIWLMNGGRIPPLPR